MRVGFLFPSSETARFIAAKLLETGYDVVFYCPDVFDLDIASNIIYELNILGKEQNNMRGTEKSFSVQRYNNLRECDIIGMHLLCFVRLSPMKWPIKATLVLSCKT